MFIILRCAEKHIKKCLKNMSKSLILIKLRFRLLTIPQILPPITPRIYNFIIGVKLKKNEKENKVQKNRRRIGGRVQERKQTKWQTKTLEVKSEIEGACDKNRKREDTYSFVCVVQSMLHIVHSLNHNFTQVVKTKIHIQ